MLLYFIQGLATTLQDMESDLPASLLAYHPSQLRLGLSDSIIDNSVSKRLLACVVAALRANGTGHFSRF